MIIKQIFTNIELRNFFYFIVCPVSGEALVVDPFDVDQCLSIAKSNNWSIKQILNTHEHGDHTSGNEGIKRATNSKLLAYADLKGIIPNIDRGLLDKDKIKVGESVELEVLYTPGHTMSHICVLSQTDVPALICGDALFNAGAGNCYSGDPEKLYETFTEIFSKLSGETQIYPGHDYIVNNLKFTLDREPDNKKAKELITKVENQDPNSALITTLNIEKDINTFFRLGSVTLISKLREKFPDMPENLSSKEVFINLRTLRNSW